jgi:hypothetical protein
MSEQSSKRVSGHTLRHEGGAHFSAGDRKWHDTGVGCGKCSCGALSEVLTSDYARKRWHREHKAAVLAESPPAVS